MDPATKSPHAIRSTGRVLEALSTLAALIDRSISEVKSLDSEFQDRIEAAATDVRAKLEEEFTKRIAELTSEWETERSRLNSDLDKISHSGVEWETERGRLSAEIERLAKVQAATQAEAEKAIMAMKAAASAAKT